MVVQRREKQIRAHFGTLNYKVLIHYVIAATMKYSCITSIIRVENYNQSLNVCLRFEAEIWFVIFIIRPPSTNNYHETVFIYVQK